MFTTAVICINAQPVPHLFLPVLVRFLQILVLLDTLYCFFHIGHFLPHSLTESLIPIVHTLDGMLDFLCWSERTRMDDCRSFFIDCLNEPFVTGDVLQCFLKRNYITLRFNLYHKYMGAQGSVRIQMQVAG